MLTHIYIHNFALIDNLELELHSGATMITGETGAGKSIILGAIDIALGQRASSEKIKAGQNRAEITLSFDIENNIRLKQWLSEQELQDIQEPQETSESCESCESNSEYNSCIIRRVFSRDGKSRCFINSRPTTLNTLKEISEYLVLLHGQHNNQLLLNKISQTQILDAFGKNFSLLDQVQTAAKHWQELNNQLELFTQNLAQQQQRIEFLNFQLQELAKLELTQEEINQLPIKYKKLANSEELINLYQQALSLSQDSENNIASQLHQLKNYINNIIHHDESIKDLSELADSASIQISEITQQLQHALSAIEIDPEQLNLLETQMGLVHSLARKHQIEPEQLPKFKSELEKELENLVNSDSNLEKLKLDLEQAKNNYLNLANKLTKKRLLAIKKLNPEITKLINQLGMPQAEFHASLLKNKDQDIPKKHGLEYIEFLIQTNPENNPMALNKVASGGELARTSLALQATMAKHIDIPTLIFDEIDVGIGGKTAAVVGKLLQQLSHSHQVICITHQPQVAASGQHHWVVSKTHPKQNKIKNNNLSTEVSIDYLDQEQRVNEIARMLSGIETTESTINHAKEMLAMFE